MGNKGIIFNQPNPPAQIAQPVVSNLTIGASGWTTNITDEAFTYEFENKLLIDGVEGNGKFVGVTSSGNTGNLIAISTDPELNTWSTVEAPYAKGYTRICFGNGVFVAIYNGSNCAWSEDGEAWTTFTVSGIPTYAAMCFGGGRFVIASPSKFAYSDDGKTWTSYDPPTLPSGSASTAIRDITWGAGKYIATTSEQVVLVSEDGINWTTAELPFMYNPWYRVAYGNGIFILLQATGPEYAYSTNGTEWIQGPDIDEGVTRSGVQYNGQIWIIFNNNSTTCYTSANGKTWAAQTLSANSGMYGCWIRTYKNKLVIMGYQNSRLLTTRVYREQTYADGLTSDMILKMRPAMNIEAGKKFYDSQMYITNQYADSYYIDCLGAAPAESVSVQILGFTPNQ